MDDRDFWRRTHIECRDNWEQGTFTMGDGATLYLGGNTLTQRATAVTASSTISGGTGSTINTNVGINSSCTLTLQDAASAN